MQSTERRSSLQRTLRALVIATVVMYVALAGLGLYVYVSGNNQRAALADTVNTTTMALCALRPDLETRVASSERFLEENPSGVPGIPAKLIQDNIRNQQRTVDALSGLSCEAVP